MRYDTRLQDSGADPDAIGGHNLIIHRHGCLRLSRLRSLTLMEIAWWRGFESRITPFHAGSTALRNWCTVRIASNFTFTAE